MMKQKKYPKSISSAIAAAKKEGKELQVSSYEITYDPMPSRKEKLPRQVRDELDDIHELLYSNPKEAIPKLLELKQKYPKIPVLYNYLAGAYSQVRNHKACRDLIIENYKNNPDYLFAKINYAQICINEGDAGKVAEIFQNKFDLKILYPNRNRFHVTEFAGFTGVLCAYFCVTGERETAELLYKSLTEVSPDSDMVKYAKSFLQPSLITRIRNWASAKSRKIDAELEKAKTEGKQTDDTEPPHFEA
jgi:hypothetical protein